jgi:hypothetical protein
MIVLSPNFANSMQGFHFPSQAPHTILTWG